MKISVFVIVTVLMRTCSGGLLFGHYSDGGFEGGGGVYIKLGGGHRVVGRGHRGVGRGYRAVGRNGYGGRYSHGRALVPTVDVLQDLITHDARQVLKTIQAVQDRDHGVYGHGYDSNGGDYDEGYGGGYSGGHEVQGIHEQPDELVKNLQILRHSGGAADVGYSDRDHGDDYGDYGIGGDGLGRSFEKHKSFKIFGFFGGHGGFVKFF